ncbi:DNA primase [Streptomyces sp. C10-9-1]|uniref:DNA primase n=1 Tax=Streptomyces sp. C10-9-1 TaxID=1859285 RepID=UPI003F49E2EA
MNTKRCERQDCGAHLSARHAHNARFCSTACRVAAHRARRRAADPVPDAMARRRQWVRYTAAKVPLAVGGPRPRPASSTDPGTWTTYGVVGRSSAGAGLGFVLSEQDPLLCIDLDHAIADGRVLPWAREILDRLPATYIEVSPSGTGVHVWGYGSVGRGRRIRRGDASIEVYDRGRYITVTRQRFENAPSQLADLTEAVAQLL